MDSQFMIAKDFYLQYARSAFAGHAEPRTRSPALLSGGISSRPNADRVVGAGALPLGLVLGLTTQKRNWASASNAPRLSRRRLRTSRPPHRDRAGHMWPLREGRSRTDLLTGDCCLTSTERPGRTSPGVLFCATKNTLQACVSTATSSGQLFSSDAP